MRPQTVVERLDFVAKRITGLKFTPPTQLKPGDDQCYGCFMSCDMYYIEIKVDPSHQTVKDVVINYGNNQEGVSCPVLSKVLAEQDFETFAKHLSGLHSIYQIGTNDKRVKQRAYPALIALESDLNTLYDHQRRRTNDCHYLVHKSPIGIMEQRQGGLPVRLTYFVTPYDLIDTSLKTQINLSIQNVIEKSLGLSATVEIEASSSHKIQVKSLISYHPNSDLPIYAPFNNQNSEKLPAQFVLNLSQPFPMLNSSINQIVNEINTEPATIKDFLTNLTSNSKESLINLIARQELDLNKGPFKRSVELYKQSDVVGDGFCDLKRHVYSIKLQEQIHTYHILDNHLEKPEGVYVTKIPFTHPTSIPSILKILRQQALFNFVIGSCIRRSGKSNINNNASTSISNTMTNNSHSSSNTSVNIPTNLHNGLTTDETNNNSIYSSDMNIFDVVPVNLNNICISFEHPSKESLATLEIDLRTISEPSCLLHALEKESVCSNQFATKVLQKCWSIPITLRSVLKKCNERRLASLEDANVRREREIQELIANNSQQTLQYKTCYQYQGEQQQNSTDMRANLNNNNSTNDIKSQDLKTKTLSVSAKQSGANHFGANTSNVPNQTIINLTTDDESATRSNLLKKFSCKPKAKQNLAQNKNQTGNKAILSLMLKRQNPTLNSTEDANIKATTTKKMKKVVQINNQAGSKIPVANAPIEAKVISLDPSTATKLANKQAIKLSGAQNVSLSLIRSPNKSGSANANITVNTAQTMTGLGQQQQLTKLNEQNNMGSSLVNNINNSRLPKLIANTQNNIASTTAAGNNNGKSRKGSIGAVLDRLVTGLNPEQQQQHQAGILLSNSLSANDGDVKTNTSLAKSKIKAPSDQFAIKQGSSGGLKLTVTKTKPTNSANSSTTSPITPTTNSNPSSQNAPSANSTCSQTTTPTTSNDNTTATGNATTANSTTTTTKAISKPDTNPLLNLGSTAPIKYTIPKISKTQSTTNQAASSDTSGNNSNDGSQGQSSKSDDINAPNSTANNNTSQTTGPSSTSTNNNNKRSTPFARSNNNSNRNNSSVSSSTHPLGRTTSNPLARPTSSSANQDNHAANRISSSAISQNQQQLRNQPQQINNNNRPLINLQQQLQTSNIQRLLNTNVQQSAQMQPTPLFPLGLNPAQSLAAQNTTDINILAMNQVAILNQQQQQFQQRALQGNQNLNSPFMSSSLDANLISSSRQTPQQQQFNPCGVNLLSQQTASSSLIPDVSSTGFKPAILQPQFYIRQPMFIDDQQQQQQIQMQQSAISSTPSLIPTLNNNINNNNNNNNTINISNNNKSIGFGTSKHPPKPNAVSSSNDNTADKTAMPGSSKASDDIDAQAISDPSSPTEPSLIEAVEPPPLIPIDSIHDPVQASSPEADHPDDCSDRLSIIDTNEMQMDCTSPATGSPKSSAEGGPDELMVDAQAPSSSSPSKVDQQQSREVSLPDDEQRPADADKLTVSQEMASSKVDVDNATTSSTTSTSHAKQGESRSSLTKLSDDVISQTTTTTSSDSALVLQSSTESSDVISTSNNKQTSSTDHSIETTTQNPTTSNQRTTTQNSSDSTSQELSNVAPTSSTVNIQPKTSTLDMNTDAIVGSVNNNNNNNDDDIDNIPGYSQASAANSSGDINSRQQQSNTITSSISNQTSGPSKGTPSEIV